MAGPAALPAIARTGAVTVGLFALCGYGAARLLLPARLRLGLYVLPVGAACSTLALTVLGLFHVPLKASLAITLAAAAALALLARRHHGDAETSATSRTPKTFSSVIPISVSTAIQRWFERLLSRFQPMLSSAGISASGSATQTDVTVRTPAKR